MNPVLADIITPIATGIIAGAQNATNQFIMSKGRKVDWERAANAGIQAAAIHAIANASSYLFGPAYSANPVVDYASAATSIACVDDGVAPRTEEQVEADGLTNVSCSFSFGFN